MPLNPDLLSCCMIDQLSSLVPIKTKSKYHEYVSQAVSRANPRAGYPELDACKVLFFFQEHNFGCEIIHNRHF